MRTLFPYLRTVLRPKQAKSKKNPKSNAGDDDHASTDEEPPKQKSRAPKAKAKAKGAAKSVKKK